jgi:hypothetical protein
LISFAQRDIKIMDTMHLNLGFAVLVGAGQTIEGNGGRFSPQLAAILFSTVEREHLAPGK